MHAQKKRRKRAGPVFLLLHFTRAKEPQVNLEPPLDRIDLHRETAGGTSRALNRRGRRPIARARIDPATLDWTDSPIHEDVLAIALDEAPALALESRRNAGELERHGWVGLAVGWDGPGFW